MKPEANLPLTAAPVFPMSLRARRIGFAALVLGSCAGLLWLMTETLFVEAPDALGVAMLLLFALTLPWTTIGFWNAVIGFVLMQASRDPAGLVAPHLRSVDGTEPVETPTALLVCIRNEDTARVVRNIEWMLDGLVATGQSRPFHLFMLSDSNEPEIIAAEARAAAALAERFGAHVPVTWRRREQSTGFKAGNIRDFCERWGADFPFAIVLDADSLMSPQAMLRLVRIMQAHPEIGILQTLVTALPSASPFARIFQFGMRLGMRSYTLGAASWQGDCGPYWGHNAILRVAPFTEHCHLPLLPGRGPLGGHVLSHDQLEAVLMRRAGYEVRVLPVEDGSFEENPPSLPEFIRRDLRWCQGNMQYLKLLSLPGLLPVSRCQLLLAIGMYLGSLAWIGFIALGLARQMPVRPDTGLLLFTLIMFMTFAPKFATLADVLVRRRLRQAYGGTLRVLGSAVTEIAVTLLVAPVAAVAVSVFILGLPFGRRVGWTTQQRDAEGLALSAALRCLWLQTVLGAALLGWLLHVSGVVSWFAVPLCIGLLGSIPLAMLTAWPRLGRAMAAAGLCRTPEERWRRTAAAGAGQPALVDPRRLFAPRAAAAAAATR